MRAEIAKLRLRLQAHLLREEGQDLVEYALIVGLISISAVVGLKGVASAITHIFTNISTTLSNA
jgi:pilus assembly protein Flp/PilA